MRRVNKRRPSFSTRLRRARRRTGRWMVKTTKRAERRYKRTKGRFF